MTGHEAEGGQRGKGSQVVQCLVGGDEYFGK